MAPSPKNIVEKAKRIMRRKDGTYTEYQRL